MLMSHAIPIIECDKHRQNCVPSRFWQTSENI